MLATLTGLGLSAAAGLNAYIPFLVVALVARFTDVITLPPAWAWIESPWAIGIGVVLLATEVVLDKVPIVDSFNDVVQTAIRPASAGIVVAATTAAQDVEESWDFLQDNAWVSVTLGVVVALLVHATKATVRPVVDAGTLGAGAPVVSTAEDTASVGLALTAIFLPVLAFLLLVGLVVVAVWSWGRLRRGRGRARP
ncbi:DUF4126 domain-containing protein [Nocardioides sp. Y6]|uniref:DUF4126 domain-containing protein n=1 Tax=Nocardioides malaquae TaxID=2773426 RepID=A0ABR9RT05_9ACTN|nr:DUF4126 domain-containing protein [Nocardioides malaquae]MBE7324714.1 DUF4126 domain-containing protein [Nocardioides malaquae]